MEFQSTWVLPHRQGAGSGPGGGILGLCPCFAALPDLVVLTPEHNQDRILTAG